MKVLLINPPIRESAKPCNFPSGLGYIASSLLEANHEVNVLDIDGHRYSKEIVEKKIKEILKNKKIEVIGVGCLITCYNYVKWLINIIKKINKKIEIIVGGGLGSSVPEMVLKKIGADIVVVGEGEHIIKKILQKKRNLSKINGIYYKSKGKIIKNHPRERIKNLDKIPFPAWHLFPMDVYLNNYFEEVMGIKKIRNKKSINLVSGRGCPYQCTFCYDPLGHQRRVRSVENLIKEIDFLKKTYHVNVFYFSDPLFVADIVWVNNFCDEVIKNNLNISWICTGRVNIVNAQILKKMSQAGCVAINYGIESGSQDILNSMRKNVTVEQASKAIQITRKAGLYAWTSFMIGMPEETKKSAEETADFCIKNDIFLEAMFFATAYPGTCLYEQIKVKGLIKNEEEYISKLGDATNLLLNITNFDNKKLFQLRKDIVQKVQKAYFKKHRIEQIKWYFKKINWFIIFVKKEGLKKTIKKIILKLKSI